MSGYTVPSGQHPDPSHEGKKEKVVKVNKDQFVLPGKIKIKKPKKEED